MSNTTSTKADSAKELPVSSPWSSTENSSDKSIRGDEHQQVWESIQRVEQEIKRQSKLIDIIENQFRQVIIPKEYQLTRSINELTSHLITLFNSDTLSLPQASLLGLWITENLETLTKHPFAKPSSTEQLQQQWQETLDPDIPVDNQLIKLFDERVGRSYDSHHAPNNIAYDDFDDDTNEDFEEDDIVFDFGWHKKESSKSPESESSYTRSGTSKSKQQTDDAKESLKSPQNKYTHLSENLSIDFLFRKLAKVLHPDKEQNDALKQKKHELMSQCLEARQNEDIHRLITLYCEHVGELPEALLDDSDEKFLNALKMQLKHLTLELQSLRQKSTLQPTVIDRYYANDESQINQQFSLHAGSLDEEISQFRQWTTSIAKEEGLADALVKRKEIEFDRMTIADLTGSN